MKRNNGRGMAGLMNNLVNRTYPQMNKRRKNTGNPFRKYLPKQAISNKSKSGNPFKKYLPSGKQTKGIIERSLSPNKIQTRNRARQFPLFNFGQLFSPRNVIGGIKKIKRYSDKKKQRQEKEYLYQKPTKTRKSRLTKVDMWDENAIEPSEAEYYTEHHKDDYELISDFNKKQKLNQEKYLKDAKEFSE